jgi:pimeloyl-ACP methyl ester carboxylesterase
MVARLDALELDSVIAAGHSMGGAIAQTLALDYPARVKGLILIGTGAQLAVNEAILTGIQTDREATIRTMAKWMWAKDVPDAMREMSIERMMAAKPAVIHRDYLACSRFDVRGRVAEISAPTLVIGGTADKMTPHKLSAFLAETIPHAELVTIEGGGHMMMLEQPQAVADAVRVWLLAR